MAKKPSQQASALRLPVFRQIRVKNLVLQQLCRIYFALRPRILILAVQAVNRLSILPFLAQRACPVQRAIEMGVIGIFCPLVAVGVIAVLARCITQVFLGIGEITLAQGDIPQSRLGVAVIAFRL